MDSLFTSVLEISWQAGLIALAVMAVRPLLRRYDDLSRAFRAADRRGRFGS